MHLQKIEAVRTLPHTGTYGGRERSPAYAYIATTNRARKVSVDRTHA